MPQPYNLVKDDTDLRVPLHPDEAFYHGGIQYQAKVSLRAELFNLPHLHNDNEFSPIFRETLDD